MFRNITRKIIRGLARAETPYVYLGKDQELSYCFNDVFKREMIFSEHTPYSVLRQNSYMENDRVHYRLFATDTLHEHYLDLEGSFDILPDIDASEPATLYIDEEIKGLEDIVQTDHKEKQVQEFSDNVEFSFLHMNRKYPSLKINLFNHLPGGSIKVKKNSDKSKRGKKKVAWEYEIIFDGKKYSGQDRFVYSRKDHAIMGAIGPENIPVLEGDTKGHSDFSYNTSISGNLSINLEMASVCSPYLNITKAYQNNESVELSSQLVSYLEDYKVTSKITTGLEQFPGLLKKMVRNISVKSGGNILCQSYACAGDDDEVQVEELKNIEVKNGYEKVTKYQRDLEYKILSGNGKAAFINTTIDCDLQRKKKADLMIDNLLDAKFEPVDNETL